MWLRFRAAHQTGGVTAHQTGGVTATYTPASSAASAAPPCTCLPHNDGVRPRWTRYPQPRCSPSMDTQTRRHNVVIEQGAATAAGCRASLHHPCLHMRAGTRCAAVATTRSGGMSTCRRRQKSQTSSTPAQRSGSAPGVQGELILAAAVARAPAEMGPQREPPSHVVHPSSRQGRCSWCHSGSKSVSERDSAAPRQQAPHAVPSALIAGRSTRPALIHTSLAPAKPPGK